jgi:hypothetical protein
LSRLLVPWLVLGLSACVSSPEPPGPSPTEVESGLDSEEPSQEPSPEPEAPTRIKVPRLVGLPLAEAKAKLKSADLGLVRRFYSLGGEFEYGVKRVASAEPPGTVIEQSPPPGARVKLGKDIRLVVAAPEPPPCDPSYPTICIPPGAPDLDCDQVGANNFTVRPPDPHGFDGYDNDGVGCES